MSDTIIPAAEICTAAGITRDALDKLVTLMAGSRVHYQSVMKRVHLQAATGRPANDAGTDVIDPPPLKVKLLKEHARRPPGAEVTLPYAEAVSLINAHVADLIR
jgi:hypothetical protein